MMYSISYEEIKVGRDLRMQAEELGACNKGLYEWKTETSYAELVQKMFKYFDFCVEHDWPDTGFIKRNFPPDVLKANGVYVDELRAKGRDMRNVAVMGDSIVKLAYHDFGFGDVRVRHTSSVEVLAESLAIVQLHLYDSAKAKIEADEGAKVTVYLHGEECRCACSGDVSVRELWKEGGDRPVKDGGAWLEGGKEEER